MIFVVVWFQPGLLKCHGIPLLVPILFHRVIFPCSYVIGLGHHPYISTGFGGNCSMFNIIIRIYYHMHVITHTYAVGMTPDAVK